VQANISSTEALESFRASLIIYIKKARSAVDEIDHGLLRIKDWLEHDRPNHWENQIRIRSRQVSDAQSELLSARLSDSYGARQLAQMAVRKAKLRFEEAEEKLKTVKGWTHQFRGRMTFEAKPLEGLHTFLANDLAEAVTYLNKALDALHAYAEMARPSSIALPQSTGSVSSDDTPHQMEPES